MTAEVWHWVMAGDSHPVRNRLTTRRACGAAGGQITTNITAATCHDCQRVFRGTRKPYFRDSPYTGAPVRIGHTPECPVSQPGFRVRPGAQQCNCDFGNRLAEHLLETMPDAYERRADGSVWLRGRRGEDS